MRDEQNCNIRDFGHWCDGEAESIGVTAGIEAVEAVEAVGVLRRTEAISAGED